MKQHLYLVMSLGRVDVGIFADQMVAPELEQAIPSRYEINQENVEA